MLSLPAQFTLDEAGDSLSRLSGELKGHPGPVVPVDASAVMQVDTAALAVLLDLQRQAHASGKHLAMQSAPARLSELASLYGVETLLGLVPAG
jgi:phospholipid transport system transporter-binding protein